MICTCWSYFCNLISRLEYSVISSTVESDNLLRTTEKDQRCIWKHHGRCIFFILLSHSHIKKFGLPVTFTEQTWQENWTVKLSWTDKLSWIYLKSNKSKFPLSMHAHTHAHTHPPLKNPAFKISVYFHPSQRKRKERNLILLDNMGFGQQPILHAKNPFFRNARTINYFEVQNLRRCRRYSV